MHFYEDFGGKYKCKKYSIRNTGSQLSLSLLFSEGSTGDFTIFFSSIETYFHSLAVLDMQSIHTSSYPLGYIVLLIRSND